MNAWKLWVEKPLAKTVWVINQHRTWNNEVIDALTRLIEQREYINVLCLDSLIGNRKVGLLSQGFHLNCESPFCRRIESEQVDRFCISESD